MSEVPVQLIVAAFQDERSADQALKVLKEARREKLIGIVDAAVLRKDAQGKLRIKETADMGGGKGAAIGGVAGAAIGVIAGPVLVVPVAVGALISKSADRFRLTGTYRKCCHASCERCARGGRRRTGRSVHAHPQSWNRLDRSCFRNRLPKS